MPDETAVTIDPTSDQTANGQETGKEPRPKSRPKGKPRGKAPAKPPGKDGPRKPAAKLSAGKPLRSATATRDRLIRDTANALKQAADPTRLSILLMLLGGERNVTEICEALGGQSQPAVSHHLALLRHGKMIEPRRHGKSNYYSLSSEGRKLAESARSFMEV